MKKFAGMVIGIFFLLNNPVLGELHLDEDTGKWIKNGFDIKEYCHIPNTQGAIRMAFGKGSLFGTDLYVKTYPGHVYRVDATGQATLFGQVPTKPHGIAFPNIGSGFGDYIYIGSADGYYGGNKTIYRMDSSGGIDTFFAGSNFMGGTITRFRLARQEALMVTTFSLRMTHLIRFIESELMVQLQHSLRGLTLLLTSCLINSGFLTVN